MLSFVSDKAMQILANTLTRFFAYEPMCHLKCYEAGSESARRKHWDFAVNVVESVDLKDQKDLQKATTILFFFFWF